MATQTATVANPTLAQELLDALDEQFGLHPGFRPAHAKGLMCSGVFTPSAEAAKLTRAPHASRPSTAVTVRFSNSTGLPTIPDNDPKRSSPRGMAARFHLAEHEHTDIVAHSTDGFPVRTGEEFLELVRAVTAFMGDGPRRSDRSSPPTRVRSGLSKRPSRSRQVSRGKPSSRSRRSNSSMPAARAVTGGFESDPKQGPSICPTKPRRRSPRTSCSTKSAHGWPRHR